MAFNWFKRQLSDKQAEDAAQPAVKPAESSSQTDATAAQATDAPTTVDTAPTNAEDYLQWAKAAYQAIQKQSSEADTTPAIADTEANGDAELKTEAKPNLDPEPAPQPQTETVAGAVDNADEILLANRVVVEPDPALEPEVLESEIAPESEAPESEIAPESEAIAPEAPPTPDPAPRETATPLPFWAKAEAERQERLERLKETAIEAEPEPEPSTAVELDEDFVWSAGVLAAQGRRPDQVSAEEITWLTKLRQGLGKTRRGLINQLRAAVGQGPLNAAAVMEIEDLLLQADVGVDATDYVIEALQARMREGALPPDEAIAYLKDILKGMLDQPFASGNYSPDFVPEKDCLNIWMLTGVNGAGKTTTIGKLAHLTRTSDYRCLIAAADTFRAAAVEQVKAWGDRSGVEVIANPGQNTDPAAVVFDAIAAAQARDVEVLLVDTAGRLQNKKNLMDELGKIRRIVDKKAADANVESLLVLDATLGQNGLRQAQVFSEAAKLSGVVLTKLDGSAKGGVALAVVQQLGLPIRFIGAGEGIEDLRPFSSYEFVEALLSG